MKLSLSSKPAETLPPTSEEIREERDRVFCQALQELGFNELPVKTKWHETHAGISLFVRLESCTLAQWGALYENSAKMG